MLIYCFAKSILLNCKTYHYTFRYVYNTPEHRRKDVARKLENRQQCRKESGSLNVRGTEYKSQRNTRKAVGFIRCVMWRPCFGLESSSSQYPVRFNPDKPLHWPPSLTSACQQRPDKHRSATSLCPNILQCCISNFESF